MEFETFDGKGLDQNKKHYRKCLIKSEMILKPKSEDLTDEKNYRPITCLNTSYKLLTGLVGKFMRNHAIENNIWDEGQLGAAEGVLGTVDQLIIDRCIMEEVKTQHRNIAVAFF